MILNSDWNSVQGLVLHGTSVTRLCCRREQSIENLIRKTSSQVCDRILSYCRRSRIFISLDSASIQKICSERRDIASVWCFGSNWISRRSSERSEFNNSIEVELVSNNIDVSLPATSHKASGIWSCDQSAVVCDTSVSQDGLIKAAFEENVPSSTSMMSAKMYSWPPLR